MRINDVLVERISDVIVEGISDAILIAVQSYNLMFNKQANSNTVSH